MAPSAVPVPVSDGVTPKKAGMPVKTREVHNHHSDSTIWNDLKLRSDDIIITTYAKSGTTWMQQIVSQLINKGDPTVSPGLLSPWVDIRFVPREVINQILESQTGRRFMKTHLPLDAMVWNPDVKYILVGRDGRDMIWSCHNHFYVATETFYTMVNDTPGRVGPPISRPSDNPRDLFVDLLEDDTRPSLPWPYWSHVRSDLDGEMRRIAKFLGTPELPEDKWKDAVEHCTFDWMKSHAEICSPPQAEIAWENGAKSFVNKGTNGRWRDVLSEEDNKRYLEKARQELGEECAEWLEKGGHLP